MMNTFGNRVLLPVLCLLPAVGWALPPTESVSLMTGHWDSVVLVTVGALVVWREINVAMQGQAKRRKKNAWGALDSWRQPAPENSGWMPVLAKLGARRSRR
jgi:hypothetical protein